MIRWRGLGGVRVRVTVAATTVAALGGVIAAVVFVAVLHESLESALSNSAEQQADTIAAQLSAGHSPQQATVTDKRDLIAQVLDADGEVAATDHPTISSPLRRTPGMAEGVHVPGLAGTYAIRAERSRDGRLVVVGVSEEQVERATVTTMRMLAVGIPVGLLMLAGVVWLAIGRALRPVDVMRREAASITGQRLDRRLAIPPGSDELPRLARTFNDLLDRIDGAHQQQRQFVADASHELRSPLAVLRQRIEVARRHPDSTTVARLAEEIGRDETRMEELVHALLTLARLDDRDAPAADVVDLDDVVLAAVHRLRASGLTAGVHLDIGQVSAGQTVGDSALLRRVVVNLLANAMRHATAVVRIVVEERRTRVVLVVEDDGHGIAPSDRERVFQRFVRLDEARVREAGGTGLGLAIVEKVVTTFGGRVTVEASDLGGARFVVVLPSATSTAD